MTLTECLNRLANNELYNLSLVDKETKTIKQEYISQVVNCINSSLTNLYTTLFLKEGSIIIDLYDGKVEYELTSEHNVPDNLEADYDHYIYKSNNEKFNDDIIKITEVISNPDVELPLNDRNNPYSVYISGFNTIQVPLDIPDMELAIMYQANHPKLDYERDPEQKIELPEALMFALFNHVAYQIHGAMNTQQSMVNSQNYFNNYARAVADAKNSGIYDVYSSKDSSKFIKNGWC